MESESILDFVRQSLNACRGTWPEVADVTGVSVHAIRKIAQGQHDSPRLDKLEKLARYFRRAEVRAA
jgi:transcriptional regulator with XRE-family HTH domain